MLVPVFWFYFGQAAKSGFLKTALRLMVVMDSSPRCTASTSSFRADEFRSIWLEHSEYNNWVRVAGVVRSMATYANRRRVGAAILISPALGAFGLAVMANRFAHRIAWFACGVLLFGALILSGERVSIFGFFLGSVILLLSGARTPGGIVRPRSSLPDTSSTDRCVCQAAHRGRLVGKRPDQALQSWSHIRRGGSPATGEGSLYSRFENWGEAAKSDPIPTVRWELGQARCPNSVR